MDPASIRYNNPGAMWGRNTISRRWGETAAITLNDGLRQGNNIAFFPTKVQGACAQFDLWRTSYCNMSLSAAIKKWSGGNSSPTYEGFLVKSTGLTLGTVITPQLLAGPQGLNLMKAQAQWEAGKPYPLADSDWHTAQGKVFGSKAPASVATKKTSSAAGTATGTVVAAGAAAKTGMPAWAIFAIIGVGILVAIFLWVWIHRRNQVVTAAQVPPPLEIPPLVPRALTPVPPPTKVP